MINMRAQIRIGVKGGSDKAMNKNLITLFNISNVATFSNLAAFTKRCPHVAIFGDRAESKRSWTFYAAQIASFVSRIARNGAPFFNVHTQGVTVTPGVSKGFYHV